MSTDHQVRDAVRALADAGPDPDVDAGWERVERRLVEREPDVGWTRRVGLALAAAAAVLLVALLVGRQGDGSPVRVDTADDPAPDPSPSPPPQDGPLDGPDEEPLAFPADAIALPGPDLGTLYVLDATTGEMAGSTSGLPGGSTVSTGAVTRDGEVWFVVQTPDGPRIGRTRWDGGDDHELLPADAVPGALALGDPAVDAEGRHLAVSVLDPDATGWILVHDLATGDVRSLRWPEGDRRGWYRQPAELSFSADGSELAFLNVHDSDGTEAFEAFVVGVDAPSLAAARLAAPDAWAVTFAPGGGLLAVVGPSPTDAEVRYLEGGPDLGVPPLDGIRDLRASLGSVVARLETGWMRLDAALDRWVPTPLDRWTGR